MYNRFFFLIFFFVFFGLTAQKDSLFRQKDTVIFTHSNKIPFHDFSVVPRNFSVTDSLNHVISTEKYQVDYVKGILYIRDSSLLNKKLKIEFLTYPESWIYPKGKPVSVKKYARHLNEFSENKPVSIDFFDGIQTKGYLTRGIMDGNNMNTSGVSKMDLHMKGKLSDNIMLEARIYDDNVPIGYEGMTTTINDLNRFFIKLSAEKWQIYAGDTILRKKFPLLELSVKSQGMRFEWKNRKNHFSTFASIVRGKTSQNQFTLTRNNYGPYPLTVNNERMLFVLRNSEEVYLNNKKLVRDKDYKIIYETGEILLLPELDFNTHDILYVTFQYANQTYRRWSSMQNYDYKTSRHNLSFFHYNETDLKLQPLLFLLDSLTVQSLSQSQDGQAPRILSAVPSEFDSQKILYRKIYNGNGFYFEHITNPITDTIYEVRFFYVGNGNGDYILEKYLSAGPVFKFNGPGNGSYSPYFSPERPENNHYTGFSWKTHGKNWQFETQQLLNSHNPNTFAPSVSVNHALASYVKTSYSINKDTIREQTLVLEWKNFPANFRHINPVDYVSYEQDWRIEPGLLQKGHTFWKGNLIWKDNSIQTNLSFQKLHSEFFNLTLWKASHRTSLGPIIWTSRNIRTAGKEQNKNKIFENYLHSFLWKINEIYQSQWQIRYENFSKTENQIPDSLSYRFFRLKNLWKRSKKQNTWQAEWQITATDSVQNGIWKKTVWEKSVSISYEIRKQNIKHRFLTEWINGSQRNNKNLWKFIWKGNHQSADLSVRQNWLLSGFGSMVKKYEVVYTRVPDGQGQFQWIDYNGNGIQEPEEFEPAYYTDQANYIRIYLPSTAYTPAFTTQTEWHFDFQPKKITRLNRILKKNEFRISFLLQNQSPLSDFSSVQLIPGNRTLQGNYFIKPEWKYYFSKKIRLIYTIQWNGQTENLQNGLLKRFLRKHLWILEWNVSNFWKIKPSVSNTYQSFFSADYPMKNYGIHREKTSIPLIWQTPDRIFKITWSQTKKISGNQILKQSRVHSKFNIIKKKNFLEIQAGYIINRFTGQSFSPAGFMMLEGLSPGQNWVLNLRAGRKFYSNMELNLNYQFRKPENIPAVHTFNLNLTARF